MPDARLSSTPGLRILQSVRKAEGFNRWMFSQCRPFIGERVLDAGCGIGSFTERLLDRRRLLCADHDEAYMEMIERRFGHLENVKILRMDLAARCDYAQIATEQIDTILSLNVLEHIDTDTAVLANYHEVLVPGGHAVILVPAHPWLYSACDKALGHVRRYTTTELKTKMAKVGFDVISIRQFNRLGAVGWLLNKMFRRPDLSPAQMRLYERLLGLARILDFLRLGPGLSLIAIGRKPLGVPAPRATAPVPMVA